MILQPSYLHNGISYTGKMTSLYWTCPLPFMMISWLQGKLHNNVHGGEYMLIFPDVHLGLMDQ